MDNVQLVAAIAFIKANPSHPASRQIALKALPGYEHLPTDKMILCMEGLNLGFSIEHTLSRIDSPVIAEPDSAANTTIPEIAVIGANIEVMTSGVCRYEQAVIYERRGEVSYKDLVKFICRRGYTYCPPPGNISSAIADYVRSKPEIMSGTRIIDTGPLRATDQTPDPDESFIGVRLRGVTDEAVRQISRHFDAIKRSVEADSPCRLTCLTTSEGRCNHHSPSVRYICTLPFGHAGDHVACNSSAHDLEHWPNPSAPPADPPAPTADVVAPASALVEESIRAADEAVGAAALGAPVADSHTAAEDQATQRIQSQQDADTTNPTPPDTVAAVIPPATEDTADLGLDYVPEEDDELFDEDEEE